MSNEPVAIDRGPADERRRSVLAGVGWTVIAVAVALIAVVPPPTGGALEEWLASGHARLVWGDELLFLGILVAGAGTRQPGRPAHLRARLGDAAIGLALTALVVVLLAVGRLVYPIAGGPPRDDILALVVGTTYGSLHLAMLATAVGTVALAGCERTITPRPRRAIAAWTTCSVLVLGSFPWVTPTWFNLIVAAILGGVGWIITDRNR